MMWMMFVAAAMAATDLVDLGLNWVCVNDTVMGGVSQSQVEPTADGMRFTGTLSLDNNGGFTSVRTQPSALSLEGTTAFRVTVQGDGRAYDFTVRRDDVGIRGGSYRVRIETDPDEPVTVEVPLTAFQATAFGRPISAPPLAAAPERISSVGFLLADKNPGTFALEVLAIEPIVDESAPQPAQPAAQAVVQTSFARAIERGVPVYNAGDPAQCAAIYQTAIESALILVPQSIREEEQAILMQALGMANQQDPSEAAWTLRRAMDALL
jgi:monofunctional biosynthetic peptidoglycan transglycosylase